MIKISLTLLLCVSSVATFSQQLNWKGQKFELKNVTASLVQLNGAKVLRVERDLKAMPFDSTNLSATVDLPTYVKLKDFTLENGIIELKVLSKVQNPSPFKGAQGFIGIAFRISAADSAYESIYLRPRIGRSENQLSRNHTVQYYSYPEYKFDRLRQEANGMYETYADIGLNEWIDLRLEIEGTKLRLYINGQKYPSFVVDKMKGNVTNGSIALWVDIGTEGYFKDLRITRK